MSQSGNSGAVDVGTLRGGLRALTRRTESRGRWLLVGAGIALMTGSELFLFVRGSAQPSIKILELSLPMAVGIGLVWYGFTIHTHDFESWQIAVLGLAVLFGMGLFVVFGMYFQVLLRFQTLPTEPLALLLNAMALGALLNLLYAHQYVRLRERADRLESRVNRLNAIIARVSHDLRNPLNVAQGYADVLDGDSPAEYREPLVSALDRIEAVVDELVVFAHSNRSNDERTSVSLQSAAREAWSMIDAETGTLDVEEDCTFPADPDRLQHLLENLFRNAVEHAGPAARVRVGEMTDADGFFVADDGPGIPPTDREAVFEPGYSTAEGGTGLGLNIVAESCQQQGWEVTLTDSAAGGTRFEFTGLRD